MSARKVPPEALKVFDKYVKNHHRRLAKETAIEMFMKDFNLDDKRAQDMFEMFDQDHDGKLSVWEFNLFFGSFGFDAKEYLDKFDTLIIDSDRKHADVGQTFDFLSTMKTVAGQPVDEDDLMRCMQGIMGEEDKTIDQKKFVQMISKIKLTRHFGTKD